jgi:hypothetical protein
MRPAHLLLPVLVCVTAAAARGGDAPPTPSAAPVVDDPDAAGVPKAFAVDFETLPKDHVLPDGFVALAGRWATVDDPLAPGKNRVLLQDGVAKYAVTLATGAGRACADGKVAVRFVPVAGKDDAAGGIVFRARDPENYYLCRANGLEDNLRLYVVRHGVRWDLASATVEPPALGAWHTLEVSFEGPKFRATYDGKFTVEATDATYASGWTGLWTKADSVTRFDDLVVTPAPAKTEPAPAPPPPGMDPAPPGME